MIKVFGHKVPDTDSIVGAIAVSFLLNKRGIEAIPFRQGDINNETKWILEKFDLELPKLLDDVRESEVFLVDFNNYTEGPENLDEAKIIGIIDHHKFGGIKTSNPLEAWIRPIGCSNTIIKEVFDYYEITIPKNLAGAMLCAILSDTVMFKSPTCTKIDTKTVKELAKIAEIDDYKALGMEMFKVKSAVEGVNAIDLIKRDFKVFDMHGHKVGVGQLEMIDISMLDDRVEELKNELNNLKEKEGFDTVLLLLTDIMKMGSEILVATNSMDVVEKAWDIKVENNQFWLDGCLSRKKQVIPFLEPAFKN